MSVICTNCYRINMRRNRVFIYLVVSMHLAGALGLMSSRADLFMLFTPLHLIATTWMLLKSGEGQRYYLGVIFVAIATYLIEMIGVNTGLIFGDYTYGSTLGLKLWGTPVLIGMNWVLLSYGIAHLISPLAVSRTVKILLGATGMVAIDFFIEPVAIAFDFWTWDTPFVPLQNYLGWWLVSAMVFTGLFRYVEFKVNPLAAWVVGAQIAFFISLFVWLKWF